MRDYARCAGSEIELSGILLTHRSDMLCLPSAASSLIQRKSTLRLRLPHGDPLVSTI
uniref:Uncharacterized protein n=1 Tax=Scytodes thoracica TaxID=1112478 RepID=A0A0A0V6Y7_SCYTH|nr:hypothetical protein [Scytodes thoracica]